MINRHLQANLPSYANETLSPPLGFTDWQ